MTSTERAAYDGKAIIGLALAVLGLALLAVPLVAVALGTLAILVALRSRGALRADPELRGATLSVLGFILGLAAVVAGGLPYVAAFAAPVLGPLVR